MTIQHESECSHQVLTQGVEVSGRNLERRTAYVTRQVAVHGAGEVKDRGVLVEVRVHDDLQVLELFEDSIDRRRTDVGLAGRRLLVDLFDREMTGRAHEHFGDRALGNRHALGGSTNHRQYFVDARARVGHRKHYVRRTG